MTPLGRPREFDLDTALERAMEAFWERGYEATSMADLTAAMGIQKGSLYQAFGDKRSLYLQALTRYLDTGREGARRTLEAGATALAGLRGWILGTIDGCTLGGTRRGCFATNALTDVAARDPEVGALLEQHFRRLARHLRDAVARGQAAGELRADLDPAEQGELLLVLVTGLGARLRGGLSKPRARRLADQALRGLVS